MPDALAILSAEERRLLEALSDSEAGRIVYITKDRSKWLLSRGGGRVSRESVDRLAGLGLIHSVYSSSPNYAYHVGPTIDTTATLAARRANGKGAPIVYVRKP